jgi:hypothetical protein
MKYTVLKINLYGKPFHKPFQKRLERKPEKRLSLRTLSPNPISVVKRRNANLFKKSLIET